MTRQCAVCNKSYASYNSLWIHNKKFHNNSKNNEIKSLEKLENNEKNIKKIDNNIKNIKNIKNIFKFKTDTFGKNKYSNDKGGDIYIIQTDFTVTGYYKIGTTTNLYKQLSHYKCDIEIEPRINCYYPIKNIKNVEQKIKEELQKYNIKRDIYKADNLQEMKDIIKGLQKDMDSEILEIIPEIKQCEVIKCSHCDIIFTNNYELTIHIYQEHKNIKLEDNQNIIIKPNSLKLQESVMLKEIIEMLIEENKKLKESTNTPNNTQNIVNNGVMNIQYVNSLNHENIKKIDKDDIINALLSNENAIFNLIKVIYMNKDIPENHIFCVT